MNKAIAVAMGLIMLAAGLGMVALGSITWVGMRRAPVEAEVLASKVDKNPVVLRNRHSSEWLKSFTLTERSGKEVSSQDLEGKVWAASFFFSTCPGACHQQNLVIAQLQQEYGPKGVVFVSITVDPDTDTPAKLREYAHKYTKSSDQWLFLTGELDYIRRVGAEMFSVPVDKGTHGSKLMLVDKWGNVREHFSTNGATSPREYAQIRPSLKELLAETEPPEELKEKAETPPILIDEETGKVIEPEVRLKDEPHGDGKSPAVEP